jgi:vacuolar-type H+-ATPase subunit F/Vma7
MHGYEDPVWAHVSVFILEVVGLKHFIFGITAALVFTSPALATANPFKDYYRSYEVDIENVVQSKTKPQVYTSQDVDADIRRMLEDGFMMLGVSSFVWTTADTEDAAKFAKKLKASIVLINYRYVETVSGGTRTVIMPVFGGVGAVGHSEPVSYKRYEQTAYFFAKIKPDRINYGLWMNELTSEQSREAGTGKGVAVQAVVRGSPAFDADVLAGDIILSFAGQDISTPERWQAVKSKYLGQTVPVDIIRGGKRITLQFTAPSAPVSPQSKKAK